MFLVTIYFLHPKGKIKRKQHFFLPSLILYRRKCAHLENVVFNVHINRNKKGGVLYGSNHSDFK